MASANNGFNVSDVARRARFAAIASRKGNDQDLTKEDIDDVLTHKDQVSFEVWALARELKQGYANGNKSYDLNGDGYDTFEFNKAYANVFAFTPEENKNLPNYGYMGRAVNGPGKQVPENTPTAPAPTPVAPAADKPFYNPSNPYETKSDFNRFNKSIDGVRARFRNIANATTPPGVSDNQLSVEDLNQVIKQGVGKKEDGKFSFEDWALAREIKSKLSYYRNFNGDSKTLDSKEFFQAYSKVFNLSDEDKGSIIQQGLDSGNSLGNFD